jgi:serine/threonine-protein kinase
MDIRPGLTLGRYTIERELGRGGMGQVMLATDNVLTRKVALKVLLPGLLTREEIVARFFREARLAAQVTHPNAAHIYDLGDEDGVLFIAMEHVDGKPLTAYVGDGTVPVERRLRWLVDIARGLGAAHAKGLYHRDMKPANVMVSKDGPAKVVDFGLAKKEKTTPELRTTFQTAQGFVIGTPAYMAPEQLEGLTVDARTDQFAWALTAYTLMLGKNLRLEDPLLFGPIPLLCDRIPGISRRTAEIILRALSHDREMRFPSMEELLGELEPSLSVTVASGGASSGTMPLGSRVANETEREPAPPLVHEPTPRMAAAPPSRKFCPSCGLAFGLPSPGCDGPHAAAFPKPPGAPREPGEEPGS